MSGRGSRISQGDVNKAISGYFDGSGGGLRDIFDNIRSRKDEDNFVSGAFFKSYNPSGKLKKTLIDSLYEGKVRGVYLDKLYVIGACDEQGVLTEKGLDKSLTLLPSVKLQVERFNELLGGGRKLLFEEMAGPIEGSIEEHYFSIFSGEGFFSIHPKSRILSIIGVAFSWSALQELVENQGWGEVLTESGNYGLLINYDENPPCFEYVDTVKSEFPIEFSQAWKRLSITNIEKTIWTDFRKIFEKALEKTYWVYSYKYSSETHKKEFEQLVQCVNHEKLRLFYKERFESEVGLIGWPDATNFSSDSINLVELKRNRDKLRLDQFSTIRKILNEFNSVGEVKVIHHNI
ncbi:hypothetical protein [Marinobacter subterrani]|uniref:hypothetical protein n=1 Tax=Marinobacter subterrani TaxID=1658765 RepID=UPI0023562D62|nr:hypothetical protein [Marinobacter subterrani]